jgi:hypothetical protein
LKREVVKKAKEFLDQGFSLHKTAKKLRQSACDDHGTNHTMMVAVRELVAMGGCLTLSQKLSNLSKFAICWHV